MKEMTNLNKKTNKKRKSKKPVRVEKTLQIVTGREFVQRDEFHGAEDPMPDITVRDLNKQRKLAERMAAEEQRRADEERANAIKVSTAGVEDTPPDEEEQPVRKSEKKKKSDTNVTDIQAVRQKEKNKKYIRKIAAAVTVVAVAVCVYCLRGRWVPKLEGILDKPHETIVNDGKTESGNFPLSVNDESTGQMTDFDGYLVMLDENHLKVYSESGEEVSSFSHSYADPVVKTAKKRMLLYDNGGNSFKVVNRKSEFFENKTDNSILMAEIADNSYTAVVTQSDKYASVVTVYDSNGIEIYNWSSSGRLLHFHIFIKWRKASVNG
jgi:hypothetical protein